MPHDDSLRGLKSDGLSAGDVPGGFAESPQQAFEAEASNIEEARVMSVLNLARDAGLLDRKTARISGRISPKLIAQAKKRTGLAADSDLIEFALATVALDDPFVEAFLQAQGTVDRDLELGF